MVYPVAMESSATGRVRLPTSARLGVALILFTSALGCGGTSAGEGSVEPESRPSDPAAAESEGAETVNPTDQCDPASVQLVGRYSLTSYPGQDTVGPNGERPMGMSKEYDFGANSYTMEGYPPLRITGRYEEVGREGTRIQVRFFETVFDGRPADDRVLWLEFDDCGTRFVMDGMTYSRRAE